MGDGIVSLGVVGRVLRISKFFWEHLLLGR